MDFTFLRATDPNELISIAKKQNIKLDAIADIYANKKYFKKDGNYIYLIKPSKEVNAGHWVALIKRTNCSFYFDSYGLPPPLAIATTIKRDYFYNNIQIQPLNADYCGIFCLMFLRDVGSSSKPKEDFLKFINKYKHLNIL